MARYTCLICNAGGGSGDDIARSPATYNCHVCQGKGTVVPIEVQDMVLKHHFDPVAGNRWWWDKMEDAIKMYRDRGESVLKFFTYDLRAPNLIYCMDKLRAMHVKFEYVDDRERLEKYLEIVIDPV